MKDLIPLHIDAAPARVVAQHSDRNRSEDCVYSLRVAVPRVYGEAVALFSGLSQLSNIAKPASGQYVGIVWPHPLTEINCMSPFTPA